MDESKTKTEFTKIYFFRLHAQLLIGFSVEKQWNNKHALLLAHSLSMFFFQLNVLTVKCTTFIKWICAVHETLRFFPRFVTSQTTMHSEHFFYNFEFLFDSRFASTDFSLSASMNVNVLIEKWKYRLDDQFMIFLLLLLLVFLLSSMKHAVFWYSLCCAESRVHRIRTGKTKIMCFT